MKALRFIREYFALLAVAAVFLWSAIEIASYRGAETEPGTITTVRIGHWQLEAGVKQGFEVMAGDYHKLHPEVRIIQDAIPESTYPQWMSTQLMGGTAPDIVEIGLLSPSVLVSYQGRYFLPLTPCIARPDPYNRGNDLAGSPLRLTYMDAMRSAYVGELREYMQMPLAQAGVGIFYNKDLFTRLTGLAEPPHEYRAFLAACEKIRSCKDARGRPYIPLAGSRFHFSLWDDLMFAPLTYDGLAKVDFNRDAWADKDETYTGFKTGRVSLAFPPYTARLQMAREVSQYFQDGYTGLTRDDAVFLFAQQRALFITSGSWDARSFQEQAKGKFRLGIMDFPAVAKDDPEFGRFTPGPLYERPGNAFAFGVTRTSRHPEAAVDFLLFMASREENEKFNNIVGWLSPVIGSKPDPFLAPFRPHLEGIFPAMDINLGGACTVKWQQLYSLYLLGQLPLGDFISQFDDFYINHAGADFEESRNGWRRDAQREEQLLTGMRAAAMLASPDAAQDAWRHYRLSNSGQFGSGIEDNYLLSLIAAGPSPDAPGPYEYSPEALRAVRERVLNSRKAAP